MTHAPFDPEVPETDAAEVAEAVAAAEERLPPGFEMPTSLEDMLGGKSGLVDSTLPLLAFIGVNTWQGLGEAVWASIAVAAVLFVIRLVRKERVRHAVSGFLGILIAAGVAKATNSAAGFFLPGILINVVYGSIFVGSVLVGRPVLWLLFKTFRQHSEEWFAEPRVKRAHAEVTLIWAAVFFARVGVQGWLFKGEQVGWLAFAKFAMGVPLYLAALAATVPWITRRTEGVPDPGRDAEAEPATS